MKTTLLTLILIIAGLAVYNSYITEYHLDIYKINDGYTIEYDGIFNKGDSINLSFQHALPGTPSYQSPYTRFLWKTETFTNSPYIWIDTLGYISTIIDYPSGSYELVLSSVHADTDTVIKAVGADAISILVDSSDTPLFIDLTFFEGMILDDDVVLVWRTESELNNSGYNIYRKEIEWEKLNTELISGQLNSTSRYEYRFVDKKVPRGKTFDYMLESVDIFGYTVTEGIYRIVTPQPSHYSLQQNYPNPFNGITIIIFQIPRKSEVNITLFDVLGKEVSVLKNDILMPGEYRIDIDGSQYASGVYFINMIADDLGSGVIHIHTKKIIIAR